MGPPSWAERRSAQSLAEQAPTWGQTKISSDTMRVFGNTAWDVGTMSSQGADGAVSHQPVSRRSPAGRGGLEGQQRGAGAGGARHRNQVGAGEADYSWARLSGAPAAPAHPPPPAGAARRRPTTAARIARRRRWPSGARPCARRDRPAGTAPGPGRSCSPGVPPNPFSSQRWASSSLPSARSASPRRKRAKSSENGETTLRLSGTAPRTPASAATASAGRRAVSARSARTAAARDRAGPAMGSVGGQRLELGGGARGRLRLAQPHGEQAQGIEAGRRQHAGTGPRG